MVSNQDKKDAQTYKEFATKGMDLMWPVRLNGRSHRPDINLIYHITIMLFDVEKDKPEEVHKIASRLALNPPDPRKMTIKLSTMQGRNGYNIYNLDLHGLPTKHIEELYNEFSHMGYDNGYKFQAHISVDKQTWDDYQKYDGKTAFEAGIQFFPAELRQGEKLLHTYDANHPHEHGNEKTLDKSEKYFSIIKETLSLHSDFKNHEVAAILSNEFLSNYLEDRPGLEEQILKKHEDRIKYHFGNDKEVINFALEHGITETYIFLNKRK